MSELDRDASRDLQDSRSAALEAARRGDTAAALAALRRAHRTAPHDPETTLQTADVLQQAGELHEARAILEAGKAMMPDDPRVAFTLGHIHRRLDDLGLAKCEFERVLAQQPYHEASRKALVLVAIAERDYDFAGRVAAAAPQSRSAAGDLFDLICVEAIARNDLDAALTFGRLAFEHLATPHAAMTLARAEYYAGADAQVEERLRWVLTHANTDSILRARAIGTLADLAHRRGDFEHAFQQYKASKRELKTAYEMSSGGRPGSFRNLVTHLAASAARLPDPLDADMAHDARRDQANHVFLLGFPRTGTTLLEQCLAGHPDVATSDEADALRSAVAPYLGTSDPFSALQRSTEEDREVLRRDYWRIIGQRAPGRGHTVFVDKMPFNSVFAGFIPLLFPTAKIIFAIRDPRDVVFSCFRRRFGMNSATYEFCTLEGTVRLFCEVMHLLELTRSKLPAPVLECRYEDIVHDLPGSLTRICNFIGLDWREDITQFGERAKRRPLSTVSAPQLARGLFDGGETWRRYEPFLTPWLRDLAPWILRFGYTLD